MEKNNSLELLNIHIIYVVVLFFTYCTSRQVDFNRNSPTVSDLFDACCKTNVFFQETFCNIFTEDWFRH